MARKGTKDEQRLWIEPEKLLHPKSKEPAASKKP